MLTRDDLIDIILERLGTDVGPRAPKVAAAPVCPPARSRLDDEMRGRKFLSEYEIKKQLTGNSQELRIPRDSILSPLAVDWLALGRIKIIRE
ncbi:MAG: hypothetical protein NTY77_20355 [Elusimicrobia bacterium]|nr:hypothetical protein [Elusimicrobiota bacterium]